MRQKSTVWGRMLQCGKNNTDVMDGNIHEKAKNGEGVKSGR